MKDDLYGPTISTPPTTSAITRGAALAVVTVSLAVAGCSPGPGVPRVVDAGLSIPPDVGSDSASAPGVDVGSPGADGGNPGLPPLFDAGVDADNPGDHT